MSSPILRPARESDLEAISQIYNEEVLNGIATFDTEPRSLAGVAAWLLGRGTHAFVAVAEPAAGTGAGAGAAEEVLGFAALYPWSERKGYEKTVENTVYTRHDKRGLGLGALLLGRVLEQGREAGLHTVLARIASENGASLRLHRKFAFEKIGTMKEVGFKFGRLLDVELMQLILKD